jgi:uncharacterized secreted protein with C-terminal beta-propeller domain
MKDLDFITSKLNEENITAPDALSEENIEARLAQGTSVSSIVKTKKNKKRILKPLVSVAACIVLVIGSFASVNALRDARFTRAIEGNTRNGVVYFESYDEIKTFTGKMDAVTSDFDFGFFLPRVRNLYSTTAKSEIAVDGAMESSAESFSRTYTQVADVDESDIVKTDGKYIYILDTADGTLVIYAAQDGDAELISKYYTDQDDCDYEEMYIDGDRAYLLGTEYDEGDEETRVLSLDIGDREEVEEVDTYRQSGAYSTSRMVDGCLYVISNTYTYDKKFIPCCTGDDGKFRKLPAEDICAFAYCSRPDYAVVGALNTRSGDSKSRKVKAVMGGADNVYCTSENLYVSCVNIQDYNATTIIKYALDGVKIKEQAVGKVKGTVNNQWSFDESRGYLRVATTAYNKSGEQVNKLYILNENLKKVGDVGGFARGEHIEAVKYIGDMAYVITYETTDPLFCIDVSNPKNPQITGKVKIDGFSTNLVPVGEDKLVGIGYHTRTNAEWGGVERAGVKLALFDISDKNAPKVLDEKIYENATSPAQETHKAILKKGDLLAIPVTDKAVVFTEKDGKLDILKEQTVGSEFDRIVCIGDDYYTVDATGDTVNSFRIK